MNQYCRYCAYMCCGDANYCSVRERCYSDGYIKQINNCKDFEFCKIDALGENSKGYQPREQKQGPPSRYEQMTISMLPPLQEGEDAEDIKRQAALFAEYAEKKKHFGDEDLGIEGDVKEYL